MIAIFASDRGPGDPERASLMSDVGRAFARKGARILCLVEDNILPVPLITAARTAKGSVELLADRALALPPALASVPVTVIEDRQERLAHLVQAASALVALPGSLVSATALFRAWSMASTLPVVMLNRHGAFDVVRGFAADVLAPSVQGHDRFIQFADNVDDLWNKLVWVREQRR
ncbi:hypothetical protein VE26_02930 [Devosia chinhatensis]|uniref:AMP nucleosidase n=2 Tax=Devosia chinhatensis TaxID=429727 RepID=A0A0F5FKA9_9HYPH|nr:hypothetical protein VE26_02930 [Devosia chinhatensis]